MSGMGSLSRLQADTAKVIVNPNDKYLSVRDVVFILITIVCVLYIVLFIFCPLKIQTQKERSSIADWYIPARAMSCPTNRTILDSSNIKQITHATYECKVIGYVLIDAKIRNMIGRKRSPINSGSTVRLSNYFEARPLAVKLVKQINTGSPFW